MSRGNHEALSAIAASTGQTIADVDDAFRELKRRVPRAEEGEPRPHPCHRGSAEDSR